ncbi:MAG TPA: response regulator [Thermoleophilaceae bacterium]|nr:response regulator [Thermoleophilaceae bacterium]
MGLAVDTFQLVVIEDHPAVAAGVERLLNAEPDLEVAGVATGYLEGTPMAERLRPDVAIVDMHLADGNGLRLTQELIDRKLARSVVIYSAFADDLVAVAALVAGAAATVHKGRRGDELVDAVRAAARGGSVRPRISIDGLVEAAGRIAADDIPILGMLVHGTSPAEIGGVLGVHERELAGRRRRMLKALLGELRS